LNEPILKKMEAAPISSAEFFTRSQARLNFDVPAGLVDPEIIPKTGDAGNDHMLEIVAREQPVRPAAVLIPVVDHREPTVLLTQRSPHLSSHAGQISFPGGKIDATDASPLDAALREAEEEVGLPRADVELLGALKPVPTLATGYAIYPFVGLIDAGREWVLSPREVEQVIEPSLTQLREGFGRQRIVRRGIPLRSDVYVVGEAFIWGATARMLTDLLERLGAVTLPG
jgi:8-oxo-dGTP pyrophosphatase MutT (NUDIX family)